ncbi:sigma-E processing peptidase SpoIIGA [Melghiribacillus thermohalophilus]|uniref:sigma-E processing peptidase SpoIIGA n=1 Tax=Melghiribacillus thermohalophilus TaxID=1324956 RepID=UPI00104BDC0E|nr:sigma-E processing peptidase SpoIIGA [Melghiribacillus thermohalophilus]
MTDFLQKLIYTTHKEKVVHERLNNVTIYLDAVWLLNFLIDWMILQLVHWLTWAKTSRKRLIFGAFVASFIVPVTIYFPDHWMTSPPGKIGFSLIILVSSFGFKNMNVLIKQLTSFYFVSFALGGGLFGLYFLLGQNFQVANSSFLTYNTGYGDMISWLFVVILFPFVFWFTRRRLDTVSYDQIRYDQMYPVTIEVDGKSLQTTGFFDSGNSLVEPFTKRPVIICDEVVLKKWFSESDWKKLKQCAESWSFEDLPDSWKARIRLIPYQGVEGKRDFLFVFRPEKIYLKYREDVLAFDRVYIGIQFGELTPDGSYHCLLHPKLMQGHHLQLT